MSEHSLLQRRPLSELSIQYAALPWRRRRGGIQVLLVTSRISKHWLIPKGWPMEGKSPAETAQQEAFEEAGVWGPAKDAPIGEYVYDKITKDGSTVPCRVEVFALRVRGVLVDWPEKPERRRKWFALDVAAQSVKEPDLARFLRGCEAALQAK